MEELWLVCEGETNSVDVAVLGAVFARVLGAGIVVQAAGGSNPGAAAAYVMTHRGGRAAHIVDRDYRSRAQAETSFHDGTNKFIWRRHSIENYLLVPAVIVRAFQRLCERFTRQFAHNLPSWVTTLPAEPEEVANALRECAAHRAAEEACRITVHRLWEDLSVTAGRVQQRIPSVPAGAAIGDLDIWRGALCQEAARLRAAAAQTVESPHLEGDAIVRRFDEIHANVTAAAYLANLEFLVDFHGRDLLYEFRHWLEQRGIRMTYDRLERELVDAVSEVYAENRTLFGTDDFLDLANGVRALTGLPALA